MFSETIVKSLGSYSEGEESWCAQVWRGNQMICWIDGFPSRAEAEKAASYVSAGAKRGFELLPSASKAVIAAGAEALKQAEKSESLRLMSRSTRRTHFVKHVHAAMASAQCVEDSKGETT